MTTPQPPAGMTWEDALLAAAAAQAATSDDAMVVSTVATLAESVIRTREAAFGFVLSMLRPLWAELDVYDGRAVQAFAEAAAEHMQTAQTVTAQAAAAAQQSQLEAIGIRVAAQPSNPLDVRGTPVFDDDGFITVERGTSDVSYAGNFQVIDLDSDASTEAIFNRPARTHRYLESIGQDTETARAAAEDRMAVLIEDNLMLAQRLAEAEIVAQTAAVDDQIIGTRRVIHPELSRTGVCGLCIAAADRVYRVTELKPVHDRCNCTSAVVTEDHDPADELNAADLGRLYKLSGGTSGAELKRVRYQVDEHGELGPVLVPARKYKPRKQFAPERTNDAPRRRRGVRI